MFFSTFRMSTTVYVHHHGRFALLPHCDYVGGLIDVVKDVDPDLFSFRDLEDYAKDFDYDIDDRVYFKNDGRTFKEGIRLVWDDASIIDLVTISATNGRMDLYVDHLSSGKGGEVSKGNVGDGIDQGTEGDAFYHDFGADEYEDLDFDDPNYVEGDDVTTDEEESFSGYSGESEDEELRECRKNRKVVKEAMSKVRDMDVDDSAESDFGSDELRSYSSSSEDENARIGYVGPPPAKKRLRKSKMYNPKEEEIEFFPGMKFVSMDEFRRVVREYGVKYRRAICFGHNDRKRCQVRCEDKCPFYIWATKIEGTEAVQVRSFKSEHLCSKPYQNKMATVKYLTDLYGERLRKNPTWTVKEMQETMREELEIEIPRIKIMRIRKAAMDGVQDTLKEHYGKVRDFGHEILQSNPRNTVKISGTRLNEGDENKFRRMYICYHALKLGWKEGCRPILGLDGCFLKTVTGGQLLSAVGRDGNNAMFPVAYAVVESENTDSWRWFLELIKDDLELGDGTGYTIISDQQKVSFYHVPFYLFAN